MNPSLHFRPLRPAVASDGASTLDLLITLRSPEPPAATGRQRPPLNLALVIDRSGSMAGRKLSHARKAARFLAGELTERDRLAIVTFDGEVNVLVASQPVRDPLLFISAINTIDAGGCTALFDGWLAGATQVATQLDQQGLNRVLLLSDGQANEGLTDADAIAAKVEGLTQRGISTSAFGLGMGFDEDLMGGIAAAGDGTLAQIESPRQLADLYASELQGLASTLGRKVSLGIRTSNGAELVDVLNDLPRTTTGNFQLPNLRYGQELSVGVRLQLPAWRPNQEIASVRLAWESPEAAERQKRIEHLTLPVKPQLELDGLDADPVVVEQMALLQANRQRRQAIEELDRGDLDAAMASLDGIDHRLAGLPQSDSVQRERRLLAEKKELMQQDRNLSRKRLRRESLRSSLSVWEGSDDEA
jgi:Ca-activated chloride channel family protein